MERKNLYAGVLVGLCGVAANAQQFGGAMSFDGVNDQVVSNANFDTTRLTVEGWVNVTNLPQHSCGFAAWGRNSDASWEIGLGEGSVAFAINWNKPTEKRFLASEAFKLGEWTHIAVTYDDTFARLYINGDLVHQSEFNMPILAAGTGGRMALNNQFPGVNEFGEAIFDEVRIWNVARSQDEIRCAMSHEINPATAGLMAYYRFNEPIVDGQTVTDVSLSGRDATLGESSGTGGDDAIRVASTAPYQCLMPAILPEDVLRGPGCGASMLFTACGEGTIQYQWYHGTELVPGATDPAMLFTNLTFPEAGVYTCIAFGDCGIAISPPATLSVCVADFDCSGFIDGDDLLQFFGAWDQSELASDFDDSGGVDGDDVIIFMNAWEAGC